MSDWNLDPLLSKLKKRGVLPQRERQQKIKKSIEKPWLVTWQWRMFGSDKNRPGWLGSRKFATEEQAVKYIEKCRRAMCLHPRTGKHWGPCDWQLVRPE